MPWGALPGARVGTILLEEHALAVVPHGGLLLRQLERAAPPRPDGGLLAVNYWHQVPGPPTNCQVWDWQRTVP